MHVASYDVPGFAALAFSVLPLSQGDGVPTLSLKTSFVEAILFCRWGEPLQGGRLQGTRDQQAAVFGSSAGNVVFGYTAQSRGDTWEESLLLNGLLEIKNLISWPRQMTYDAAKTEITLPAAGVAGRPLDHTRHTMRVLFNQHQVPPDVLVTGQDELLFDLARDRSWQFLAVVEHQLIDVFPGTDLEHITLHNDRRWTAVQEVRLLPPTRFKRFLDAQSTNQVQTVDPGRDRTDLIGNALYGYLGAGLRALLTGGTTPELDRLAAGGALLVEASALHWVKQVPVAAANATTLQFLPQGTQLATPSNPQDYGPSDPQDPRWLLLTTPFLGRLQDRAHDGLEQPAPNTGDRSALQLDPVLHLHRKRAATPSAPLPNLALALSTWGGVAPTTIDVSGFDAAIGRTWARLDPVSLEENWFRLQNPVPETTPSYVQSVLASLPATPARLSRPAALRHAWDASIRRYPPSPTENGEPSTRSSEDAPVWGENSLLAPQGISSLSANSPPPYGWYMSALQIITSDLARQDPAPAGAIRRYVAATVLPTSPQQHAAPLGFAVSPYLGLEMRPAAEAAKVRLVFAELLCLDAASGTLLSVASQVWEAQQAGTEDGAEPREVIHTLSMTWACESHRRLSPESPIAVLRYREILETAGTDTEEAETGATLKTDYAFAIVANIWQPRSPAKPVFRLRSAVQGLRFREGQFGGGTLPARIRPFEIAPPQTSALQPLYLTERPVERTPGWPWGLSALHVGVQYTQGKEAAIGHLGNGFTSCTGGASGAAPPTLWWQGLQHAVQYRVSANSQGPAAGLPPRFRAVAIKSLLPVSPGPPLPAIDLDESPIPSPGATPWRWQPVLPGSLRYMLVGTRSGMLLAMRHALLSQSLPSSVNGAPEEGMVMLSGSVPVQHRVPRPVPLPENHLDTRATALRPWASYFEPERNRLATASPADEAFFAACGEDRARGLRMELEYPLRGAIPAQWGGSRLQRRSVRGRHCWPRRMGHLTRPRRWRYGLRVRAGRYHPTNFPLPTAVR